MALQTTSLSTNTFVPVARWDHRIYEWLRTYKCIVPCERAPRQLKEWKHDMNVVIMNTDVNSCWSYCTIEMDDHKSEAVYFFWTGKLPVTFNGLLQHMELISMKTPQGQIIQASSDGSSSSSSSSSSQ